MRLVHLVGALLCVGVMLTSGRAWSLSDARLAAITDGISARRTLLLGQEVAHPFPAIEPRGAAVGDALILGNLNDALAALTLHRNAGEVARANDALRRALVLIQADPVFRVTVAAKLPGPPLEGDDLHFELAQFLFRILQSFGSHGVVAVGLLDPTLQTDATALLFSWARTRCRLTDTDATRTWRIWGSENHGAQRDASCWAAADLAAATPDLAGQTYADGSTPAQQLHDWTAFLKAYLVERGKHGTFVEYFSPTYAQYTLLNVYLYADFSSDADLRRLATQTLDLWWGLWAQEQIDGLHGGSETRAYPKTIGTASPMRTTGWLYFNLGQHPAGVSPGEAAAAVSRYVPPPVVTDIAVDTAGRGTYDVFTRAPGLAAQPIKKLIYTVDSTNEAILRVTHVGAGFVMGSAMLPRVSGDRWAAISAQNRRSGVVLAGGDPGQQIVVAADPTNGRSSYNTLSGVQSEATLIAQSIPSPDSKGLGGFGVWFGKPLHRQEADGWIFVDGAAFVAVRPAWGGYSWDPRDPRMLRPTDPLAPVILQGASRRDYPDLQAFEAAVRGAALTVDQGVLRFQGLLGAGRLTVYSREDRLPEIDGKPITLAPTSTLKSPFINEVGFTGHVVIQKDHRAEVIDFAR